MPQTPRRPSVGRPARVEAVGNTDHRGLMARFDAALAQAENLAGELADVTGELRAYVHRRNLFIAGADTQEERCAPREDPGPGSEDGGPSGAA